MNDPVRRAAALLLQERINTPGGETYVFINNRMEGNALETISAIIEAHAQHPAREVTFTKSKSAP